MGIALLPVFIDRGADFRGRLVRVLPQVQTEPFAVQFLYPPQNVLPPALRSFIETALESQMNRPGGAGGPDA
jgi:DNA-binding transcriptional LysR family regulator